MSLYDDFEHILRKERRACTHVHQTCPATKRAMFKAFELGLDAMFKASKKAVNKEREE